MSFGETPDGGGFPETETSAVLSSGRPPHEPPTLTTIASGEEEPYHVIKLSSRKRKETTDPSTFQRVKINIQSLWNGVKDSVEEALGL